MMAFNFKLPCAVTCPIISFRGVRRGKKHDNDDDEPRNDPWGQINNFVVAQPLFALLAPPTCQPWSLLIGVLRVKTSSKKVNNTVRCSENVCCRSSRAAVLVYMYNNVKWLTIRSFFTQSSMKLFVTEGGKKYKARYFNWQAYLSNYHFAPSPHTWIVWIMYQYCSFCVSMSFFFFF